MKVEEAARLFEEAAAVCAAPGDWGEEEGKGMAAAGVSNGVEGLAMPLAALRVSGRGDETDMK